MREQVLGMTHSPFPVSYDGSGMMFGFALFSLIVIASLSMMIGSLLVNHLFKDRRCGYDGVAALRSLVLAFCVAAFIRCSPEVAYNVAYAEASPSTLQTILFTKRVCDTITLIPFMIWAGTFWAWYPDMVLKLRSTTSMVWSDNRLASLKRFISIVLLSGALASAITLGRALN